MKNVYGFILGSICFFSATLSLNAQLVNPVPSHNGHNHPAQRTCGTDPLPANFENWLQPLVQNVGVNDRAVYTLPVIVHVIHNGEAVGSGTNISAAQIQSQINVLNQDYRKTNSDISLVPSVWTSRAADCEINFCMAVTDPSNAILAEPGIHRVNRNTAGFTAPPYTQTYIDATIKPATIWNTNQYLNIWVMNLGGGLLGYATFPNPGGSGLSGLSAPYGSATTDGVVILYTAFGNTGNVAAPYNKGRTATHEVGHWLGLRHIWGDSNCGTDYCTDTPTSQTSNYSCPTFPQVTCSNGPNGDMFMNYMDYTDDACMYMFTNDQKTRVQAIMANSPMRMALATSTRCTPPYALDAGIASIVYPTGTTCLTTFAPIVRLTNFGSSTLTSCTITYNVDGGASSNFSWTGSLTSGSSVNVTLPSFTVANGAHTYTAATSLPNGSADQNNGNNSSTGNFTVISAPAGAALPFTEGFQNATFIPTGWTLSNPDANNTWSRVTTAGGFGTSTASAKMDNFSGSINIAGQSDIMQTPALSFVGATSPLKLDFNVAHARYNASYSDSLIVAVSVDCGGTWTRVYAKGNSVLATAPDVTTAFTPTAAQWRAESINLDSYIGLSSVLVRFQSISGFGNNVYVDDINLYYSAASLPTANFTGTPTTLCQGSTVTYTNTSTNATSYAWTFAGGTPATSTATNPTVTYNTPGTYSVTLVATNANGNNTFTRTNYITVNATPTATAASNSPVCSGTGNSINLTTPTVAGATYAWTGPGGYTSTQQNPTRTNATTAMAGTYTVTVTANGCTATSSTTVVVNATPTATAGSNTPVCSGNTINLTGNTVAGATYAWTGPGGFTSTLEDPTRPSSTTAMAGTYSLTITSNGCGSAASNTTVVVNSTPTANAGSNSPVCAGTGNTLSLTTTTVAGATYAWTGPGGYTSTQQNPNRNNATVGMSGTYTVTVTANGCSATSSVTVVVSAAPTATAGSNTPVCAGNAINLTANTVAGATYSWTGPNGFTSSLEDPSIAGSTSAMAGTYTVVISVGSCTATSSTTVVVNNAPTANAGSNSPVCAGTGNTLSLTTTTVAGATYAWTGPGGYTSTQQNPNRTNATVGMSGTYTVTVTLGGCTATSSVTVVVSAAPTATAGSNTPVCSGNAINLTANTVAGATYSWTGPGGFTSSLEDPTRTGATTAMAGTYTVVISVGTCTATSSTTVVVNNTPTANAGSNSPVCSGTGNTLSLTTTTVAGATYAWTGPAGYTSTQQNPNRNNATTAMSGTYTVTVTASGCSATSSVTVTVNQTPGATAGSNSPVCAGSTLNLTGNTPSGTPTYSWTGPNGFTSTLEDPSITNVTTAASGVYTLTITRTGCSASSTTTVVVNASPVSSANNNGPLCAGNNLDLTATTAAGATYSWTGPNGFTSTTQSPSITGTTSANSGTYTLVVTAAGCSSTYTTTATVNDLPVADAGVDVSVCGGNSVTLNGNGGTTYSWSPSAELDNGSLQNPVATPTATTTYTVTVSDALGCSSTDDVVVTFVPAVTATASNDITICEGDAVNLSAGGGTTYSWSPITDLDDPNIANPVATPGGTTTYTVTATTGICSDTEDVTITVNPAPSVPTISQNFADLNSSAGTTYQWYLNGTPVSGATSQTYTPTANGSYTVEITDANGCSAMSAPFNMNNVAVGNIQNDVNLVSIYPNPNNGAFVLEIQSSVSGMHQVEITNAIGQVVYANAFAIVKDQNNRNNIDIATYGPGVYFVKVSYGDKVMTKRIVLL